MDTFPLIFIYLLSFLLGLTIGSFLNVVIYRTEKEKSFGGRSICPKCKKKIPWYDNIPLISYLILGGHCRFCKKKISSQYPLVEMATGLLFLLGTILIINGNLNNFLLHYFAVSGILTLINQPFSVMLLQKVNFLFTFFELIFIWAIVSISIVIFVYDSKHMLIPDSFTWAGIKIVAVFNLIYDFLLIVTVYSKENKEIILYLSNLSDKISRNLFLAEPIKNIFGFESESYFNKVIHLKSIIGQYSDVSVISGFFLSNKTFFSKILSFITETRTGSGLIAGLIAAFIFYSIVRLSHETWMGMGDVKLAFLLGFLLGFLKSIIGFFLAFEIGAVWGLSLIFFGKAKLKTAVPFGPFLILGMVLAIFL